MKNSVTLLLSLLCVCLYAQQKPVKINRSDNLPEETSIAINPLNPKQVAASSNVRNYYFSTDGGKTWNEREMSSRHGIWGDPVVHYDALGNLYYAHLGKNPDKFFPMWIDHMVVQRINHRYDSGFADAALGFNNGKIQDKEWLSSDKDGNVCLTWTEFDKYESKRPEDHSRIRFSRSEDRGATWSVPINISDVEGDCLDGDSTMEGATSCIDTRGIIYVCWSGINKLWFDRSVDGGKTFGTDNIIGDQVNGWEIPIRHLYRSNGMPFLACDISGSRFKDRIYVNWTDTRNGDADIFVKYSDDGGSHWSRDIRVNNDALNNGTDQFSNNFCIDPANGNLYSVFYDKRNSSTGAYLDVYIACSSNGGETWTNYRMTPRSFPAAGKKVFFGDYIDIDAVNGKVMPAYTIVVKDRFEIYTSVLDTAIHPEAHVKKDLQATILDDSLYIHLVVPPGKKFTLRISANGRNISFNKTSAATEQDFVVTARGFNKARVTVKYGLRKRSITVSKMKQG
jgi:hypothetical protein